MQSWFPMGELVHGHGSCVPELPPTGFSKWEVGYISYMRNSSLYYVVVEFISIEQWPPSGKKEDKEVRTQRGPPGLNLAQVCILFFSPTSRQLNLSANRKTKENVFSEAHGNSAPQATETLKGFHSVLSGVLYQSQIMRNTGASSRGHMSPSISLPFLGDIEQEPHNKCSIPESGERFWVTRVSSFSHLSFLALWVLLCGQPPDNRESYILTTALLINSKLVESQCRVYGK